VRVYVWQVPVRLTHWAIALSLFVAAFTGYFISNPPLTAPGPAREHFFMGTLRLVHFYAAIVFSAAVLARALWSLVGNRYSSWRIFLPVEKKRFKALLGTLGYYLFLLRKPPGFVGHNPLAGLVYFFVWLLYCLMILTGLAMLSASAPVDSYLRWFGILQPLFGGLAAARPPPVQRRPDVEHRAERHAGVDRLGLQVRATRGPAELGLSLRPPRGAVGQWNGRSSSWSWGWATSSAGTTVSARPPSRTWSSPGEPPRDVGSKTAARSAWRSFRCSRKRDA